MVPPNRGGDKTTSIDTVTSQGRFLVGDDSRKYFLPSSSPIPLRLGTRAYQAEIRRMTGLKPRARGTKAFFDELEDYAQLNGERVRVRHCTALDEDGPLLRVNLGGGKVAVVKRNGLDFAGPYSPGLLFVDEDDFEPVDADALLAWWRSDNLRTLPALHQALLDDLPPPAPSGLSDAEQRAVALAWLVGVFMGEIARARPALALTGDPGCAKTARARLLGLAFYGRDYDVSTTAGAGRALKDLAAALAHRCLVIRDDMQHADTATMDLICCACTGGMFELATYYETLESNRYPMRAALAITAHTPTWALREDVLSRFLVMRFDKPPRTTLTLKARSNTVASRRVGIWAELLWLLWWGLFSEERPEPITRFEDWEIFVRRTFAACGYLSALDSALRKMPWMRIEMATRTEPALRALYLLACANAQDPEKKDHWYTAAEIHDAVAESMGIRDSRYGVESSTLVRNPVALGKFLAKLEREGSAVVTVERGGSRENKAIWRIRVKE